MTTEQMTALIESLAKRILEQYLFFPDKVSVEGSVSRNVLTLQGSVDPADYGKAVGKKAQNIIALQTILRVVGQKSCGVAVRFVLAMPREDNPLFCAPDTSPFPDWNPRPLALLLNETLLFIGPCPHEPTFRRDGNEWVIQAVSGLPDGELREVVSDAVNKLWHAMARLSGHVLRVELK